ncbi:hypothetical protein ACLOJK_014193 [Asimina triloba]
MIDLTEFPLNYSLITLLFHCLHVLRKVLRMALRSRPPLPYPSGPTHRRSMSFSPRRRIFASVKHPRRNSGIPINPLPSEHQTPMVSGGLGSAPPKKQPPHDPTKKDSTILEIEDGNGSSKGCDFSNEKTIGPGVVGEWKSVATCKGGEASRKNMRKRPTRIAIPQSCPELIFDEMGGIKGDHEKEEAVIEGEGFYLASKRGKRKVMEDGYRVITSIHGDSKQAFFGVFDGHGGREAVDYVAENLGKNIITAMEETERGESQVEEAIRRGYLLTDKGFISKDVGSGVCVATVMVKDGELHAANLGDCRVVLSRNGTAEALTSDHRVEREDEQLRIERTGGFVSCHNGVWRVHSSLAVSRAIGDAHLKEWIISEPETKRIGLTSDCDFLIMASDGLWDKVGNQEAVDVVMKNKNSIESCKKLVDLPLSRGSKDDITVLVLHLANFIQRA